MKIMTAMYTIRKGGAYARFIMMIEAFLERGWEVHCLSLTPIQIRHPLFHNHFIYWPFSKLHGSLAKVFVLLVFPIWAIGIGLRYRINLIIAFGVLYACIQVFSKYILNKPMVTFIRGESNFGLIMQKMGSPFINLIRKVQSLVFSFSDLIITNNMGLKEDISKKIKKKKRIVEVLFNNIPPMQVPDSRDAILTRVQYKIDKHAKVLVTVGVLNPGKRFELLIGCLKSTGVQNLHLFVVGEGSKEADFRYEKLLKDLTKKLRVEDQVHFTGWVDKEKLNLIFKASDLFVLPSSSEGMPNALLEALGSGLPCIGSDIMGIRDILHYDELLFDPFNERALANKIKNLFTDQGFFDHVKKLCQERKDLFVFDWKERVFKMITSSLIFFKGGGV